MNKAVASLTQDSKKSLPASAYYENRTDAVGKKVFRELRRSFVDEFTELYGKGKDKWSPDKW